MDFLIYNDEFFYENNNNLDNSFNSAKKQYKIIESLELYKIILNSINFKKLVNFKIIIIFTFVQDFKDAFSKNMKILNSFSFNNKKFNSDEPNFTKFSNFITDLFKSLSYDNEISFFYLNDTKNSIETVKIFENIISLNF
jgi:hypothetical protein